MATTNGVNIDHSDELRREGARSKSEGFVGNIAEKGKERIETEKQAAAEQADKLAGVVERATEDLDRGDFPSIAGYASQLAARMKYFANGLRDRSIEELIDDARAAARRSPELFLLGSIAAGVGLARFFKASQRQDGWQSGARTARSGEAEALPKEEGISDGQKSGRAGQSNQEAVNRARADFGSPVKGA